MRKEMPTQGGPQRREMGACDQGQKPTTSETNFVNYVGVQKI